MSNEHSLGKGWPPARRESRPGALAAILIILLLAAFLRLYRLPALPPGLNFDEAGSGVAALDILQGRPKLWWPLGGGQEPLWPYLTALSTAVLGNIPLALRLPAALAGLLTVAAAYKLAATMFLAAGQARRLAGLTALGLAVSGWHLHFSRLGFRAILLPLFSTLAFYFFWRCLAGQGRGSVQFTTQNFAGRALLGGSPLVPLSLSALFTALAIYSYLGARLLPLVPLLFLALHFVGTAGSRSLRALLKLASSTASFLPGLALAYALVLIVCLLPLIIYFSLNPADFLARSATVSIFNPAWNKGEVAGTAWHTLVVTLGTFTGLGGDANPLVNLPGQPAVPLLLAPFFVLGLLIALYRVVRHRPGPSPHLFLLCWWLVMILPAVLAPEGAPHHLRLLGALTPTYILVAVGLLAAGNFLSGQVAGQAGQAGRRSLAALLPVALYVLIALQSYTNYFVRWPAAVDFTLPFDLYAVRLAGDIAAAPPEVGYVLPMDIRAGWEARHYTLDYLLADRPAAAYTYLPVAEDRAARLLNQAAQGKIELRVVRWTADKQREADAKEIVTYLLATTAQLIKRDSFPVYDIETYALPGDQPDGWPGFSLPVIDRPIGATFEGLLQLEAAFVASPATAGSWLPVALAWRPLAPMAVDYKASVRLVDPSGRRLAQKDRGLLHDFHQGTSLWPAGTVHEYYLLPVPAETPPGDYTVTVVVYQPETLAPLAAEGRVEVPVGRASIEAAPAE